MRFIIYLDSAGYVEESELFWFHDIFTEEELVAFRRVQFLRGGIRAFLHADDDTMHAPWDPAHCSERAQEIPPLVDPRQAVEVA